MSAKFRGLLGLTVVLTCTAWGQQRFGGYVTFNKILVAFAPIASSGNGEQIVQSRTYVGKDAIHRVIFNSDGSLYFGYDFVVEALANSKFLVTMKPLSAEGLQSFLTGNNTAVQGSGAGGGVIGGVQAEAKTQTSLGTVVQRSGGGGGVMGGVQGQPKVTATNSSIPIPPNLTVSTPQIPPPQIVSDGDTVSVDLLVNPQTGVKISDVIKIAATWRSMSQDQASPSQPDGRVKQPDTSTLWAYGFDVIVDGKLVKHMGGGCSGNIIYFTVGSVDVTASERASTGSGIVISFRVRSPQRFILSTQPYEGYDFRNVGIVDGNSMKFVWNDHTWELICSEPVLEGGARSRLWVLYDGGPDNAEPDLAGMASAPAGCGAADRIESLFRRK
jgi:hypothetical protein